MSDTIPSMFVRQAARLATQPIFLTKQGGAYRPITWAQAAAEVRAFSSFLLAQGVKAGDRVLILSENRPEWGITDLAVQSVGAWSVPIYPTLTVHDIQMIATDCQPVMGVASNADQAKKLLDVSRTVSLLRLIIVMDLGASLGESTLSWSAALTKGREQERECSRLLDECINSLQPEQTATLIYTSGTTGEPKGVMLSHRNFLSNATAAIQVIPISGSDLHLSFLPLSHVFERMAGWYLMLMVGASIAYAESMDTIPQNMVEVHPTIMLGVPRFFEKLYARIQESLRQASPLKQRLMRWALGVGRRIMQQKAAGQRCAPLLRFQHAIADRLVYHKLKAKLGGRLRFFVSGSAPLSQEIGEFFYSMGVTILEGYGLTETSPVIAVNRLETPRFGSVGPLLPGVEVRIAEDGEILSKGPHIMQGYYKRPEATAAVMSDGWFHTGDIGHLDSAGCLVITDRKKDLIKTAGGKFVAPQQLENLLVTDPYISQALVYGDRRPYCVALIVPNQEQLRRYAKEQGIAAPSLQALVCDQRVKDFYWTRVQMAQQALASFEQVKRIALVDQEFSQAAGELTPTMKAKRNIIAQRCALLLNSLYEGTS